MFCTSCGKQIDNDSRFCPFCGATITDVSNTRNTRISTSSIQCQSETSKTKGGNPNVRLLVLGLCLAIVVIVFIAFIAQSSTGSNDNTTSDNSNHNYTIENDSDEEEYNDTTYDSYNNYDDYSSNDAEEGQGSSIETETTIQDAEAGEYVLPTSDSEYLTRDDLAGFTAEECRLARNEIYARHGRMFQDEELQNYFNSFDWYQPTIESDDFQESMLNQYEIANRDLIVAYEIEQGYR